MTEQTQDRQDVIQSIINELDGTWTAKPLDRHYCTSVEATRTTDGLQINLSIKESDSDRVHARAVYPAEAQWTDKEFTTSSSVSRRDTASIARQIKRNVIDPFEPVRAKVLEEIEKVAQDRAAANALRDAVMSTLGLDRTTREPSYYGQGIASPFTGDTLSANFEVSVRAGSQVTIRGMTEEQTLALAGWLTVNAPRANA